MAKLSLMDDVNDNDKKFSYKVFRATPSIGAKNFV